MTFDWNTEMRPLLVAIKDALDAGGYGYTESAEINSALGRPTGDDALDDGLKKLKSEGYIDGYRDGKGDWSSVTLVGKGLQTVAGWPARPGDDTYELLLAALSQRIESAPTEDEKSKWIKLRDGIANAGRDLVIDVLGNVATQGLS